MSYLEKIDPKRIPTHVSVIMDGNGRWAKRQGKPRSAGHEAGAEAMRIVTEAAAKIGIKYLTLYTFSVENWNRPEEEVTALMTLLLNSIEEEIFMKNNVSMRVIGDIERLPQAVQTRLQQCIERTSVNTGMCVTLALSYSSKWEIVEAVKHIAIEAKEGRLRIEDIDDRCVDKHLATQYMPDPDLLIRTGGEIRLSNYLMWQHAYSELYFCDTYWPDFGAEALHQAIYEYQQRERRYGKTSEQL